MTKLSFHEAIAQKLIEQMKQGTSPWQCPWQPGIAGHVLPMNPVTGKRYRGINALQLMSEKRTDQRWMTYKQAAGFGAQVLKGEKGTAIQYWAFTEEKIKKDDKGSPILDENGKSIKMVYRLERPRVFFATVFNAEQIQGLPPLEKKMPTWDPIERAEKLLNSSGADIHHIDADRAFYRISSDSIHIPQKEQFLCAENYYATALHELGHWTGHSSRLDRDLVHPFGSEGYAKEELRAEIASMILGDELGVGYDPNQHVAYVSSWIQILQNDPLELFRAAADAEKIQEFVLSFEHVLEQTQTVQVSNIERIEEANRLNSTKPQQYMPETQPMLTNSDELTKVGEKIWLNIPFKEKEAVKNIAGKLPDGQNAIAWDKDTKSWFAQVGADLELLKPWLVNDVSSLHIDPLSKNLPKTQSTEKTWLAIPYNQREVAKQLTGVLPDGRRAIAWDKAAKCWFAHAGADLDKLKPWILDSTVIRQNVIPPQQEFSELLKSIGAVLTDGHPIMDGNKHRVRLEDDKRGEKSGFYVGHLDGHPAGYIKNNRTGVEIKWKSKGYVVTEEQKQSLLELAVEKHEIRRVEQAQIHEKAAHQITEKLAGLMPILNHTPYMKAKGIAVHQGIYTDHNEQMTCIPAMDTTGKIWTVQYIQDNGLKRFAKDARKEGCFHVIGGIDALSSTETIVICEGYATAASVTDAINQPCVVAFDAGNLESVARALHDRFPEKIIILAGDDDKSLEITKGINPGRMKAIEAATAVNGLAVFPIFAPNEQSQDLKKFTDFNDLASQSVLGIEGVRRQIQAVVNQAIAIRNPTDMDIQKQEKALKRTNDAFNQTIFKSKKQPIKGLG